MNDLEQYAWFPVVMIVLALWSIPWKGWALWRAAKNNQLPWFIVFMVVNTVGILEIIYIFLISKKEKKV